MSGHFFLIRGRQSGLVLDVQGGAGDAGSPVALWEETGAPNQLWFYDRIDGVIRSKLNGMCLDYDGENTLVINEYNGEYRQLFEYDEGSGTIKNSKDSSKVLDVAENETDPGSRVCVWEPTGEENQLFDLEYQPPQYFMIISKMNGKCIDVKSSDASAGAKLIMFKRTDNDNQLFYQDRNSLIRSKITDYLFESQRRKGKSIQLHPEDGGDRQAWTFRRDRIVNVNDPDDDAVEIKDAEDDDEVKVIYNDADDGLHQKWELEYV